MLEDRIHTNSRCFIQQLIAGNRAKVIFSGVDHVALQPVILNRIADFTNEQ